MTPDQQHRAAFDWTTQGAAFAAQQRFREAADCFRRAIEADPDYALAHNNLAACLERVGDLRGAAASYQRVVELEPNNVQAHHKLGDLHVMLGELAAASDHYQKAVHLAPDSARAHQNLASSLATLGRNAEAIDHFRRAVALEPARVDLQRGLGLALTKACAYGEAEECLRRAVQFEPANARAHANLGQVLMLTGRVDEALRHYDRSIELNPRDPEPRMGRATCRFLKGEFEAGWAEYEARLPLGYLRYHHDAPRWDGSPLAGRTLLIEAEQGLGDTIQFVRYAAEIKKQHDCRIVFACQPPLIPLLTGVAGVDVLLPQTAPRPAFECWTPLLSVPGIFHHGLSSFPSHMPYLQAEAARVAAWKSKLAALPGRKIGIAWQGNVDFPQDRERSIPLDHFLSLAQLPDVTLICLQKGPAVAQLAAHPDHRIIMLGDDFDESGGAFLDTAAVMMNLDLVITSDTSIPHLAGALAGPTWVALPFVPHWHWTLTGERTPWYPTMRLFRQTSRGDWNQVFDQIAAALKTQSR